MTTGKGLRNYMYSIFRFVTLLMDLLCMMFHESEIIPERTIALKTER